MLKILSSVDLSKNQTEAALWGEFQFQSIGDYQQINR